MTTRRAKGKLASIQGYVDTRGVPPASLVKMAKFGAVVDELDQGQSSSQARRSSAGPPWRNTFGVVPCTLMSMMSNHLLPSACETDMIGMIGMYILQLASGDTQRHRGLEQQLRRGSR